MVDDGDLDRIQYCECIWAIFWFACVTAFVYYAVTTVFLPM